MHINTAIIATLATIVIANPVANPIANSIQNEDFCGSIGPTDAERQEARDAIANVAVSFTPERPFHVTVPVYLHVVAFNKTFEGGYLKRHTLDRQMHQFNTDFKGTGFKFRVKDIDWTINSTWAEDEDWDTMRRQLPSGKYSALNLYFQSSFVSGYCYPPRRNATDYSRDGCYISKDAVPGGPGGNNGALSGGMIAAHETGHWIGLYHTFQGGCSEPNDEVDNTPAEAEKFHAQGCPVGADTCPDMPGLDPIHNHMTYAADYCHNEFTSVQIDRMQKIWMAYRDGK